MVSISSQKNPVKKQYAREVRERWGNTEAYTECETNEQKRTTEENSAINAGSDAIYLAGKKYGARASADNFETQQLIYALKLAHLHGKRIYLTLNTLIKEREFGSLYDFLKPLYDNRLDGVIVQDLGLIDYIKDNLKCGYTVIDSTNGIGFLNRRIVMCVVPTEKFKDLKILFLFFSSNSLNKSSNKIIGFFI